MKVTLTYLYYPGITNTFVLNRLRNKTKKPVQYQHNSVLQHGIKKWLHLLFTRTGTTPYRYITVHTNRYNTIPVYNDNFKRERSSPSMFQFETINYYFYKSREDRTYTCVVFYTVSKYFYPPGLRISGKFNLRLVMDICKSAVKSCNVKYFLLYNHNY